MTDFTKSLKTACDVFGRLSCDWRMPELQIVPPASIDEVNAVQQQLTNPIPDSLVRFFCNDSQAVYFLWVLDSDKFHPPAAFQQVTHGQCEIALNSLSYLCSSWFTPDNCVRSKSHGGACRFDYSSVFPFIMVDNGDELLISLAEESKGSVVYFAHEGNLTAPGLDDTDMPIIGRSLPEFLEAWLLLGCPGPEIWALEPFLDPATGHLSAANSNAREWRAFAGLA